MIVRLVLAVALATALVASALVPLDDARRERGAAVVADQASAIERRAATLLERDDPTEGAGARRIVTLDLPARSWTSARVDRLTLRPGTDATRPRITWRVVGGRTHTRRLPNVPLATEDGTPLVVRGPGLHRLTLSLDGRPGAPVVTVRRLK